MRISPYCIKGLQNSKIHSISSVKLYWYATENPAFWLVKAWLIDGGKENPGFSPIFDKSRQWNEKKLFAIEY